MGSHPKQDPRILEALESCRPHSDDLDDPALWFASDALAEDPALKQAVERLQELDAALSDVFSDVPVPAGLSDRIAARLAEVSSEKATLLGGAISATKESIDSDQDAPPRAGGVPPSKHPRKMGRRWLLAGSATCVAATLLVGLFIFVHRSGESGVKDLPDLCRQAADFFQADLVEGGERVARSSPPAAYPCGSDFGVSSFPEMRWRKLRDFLGSEGVAYDLHRRGGPRATLYVVRMGGLPSGLPGLPPLTPTQATRNVNVSVGAWQSDQVLYVLAVEGDARAYRSFVSARTLT